MSVSVILTVLLQLIYLFYCNHAILLQLDTYKTRMASSYCFPPYHNLSKRIGPIHFGAHCVVQKERVHYDNVLERTNTF